MYLVKGRIHSVVCRSNRPTVFAGLLSRFENLSLDVIKADEHSGEIVIRYLSLLVNWVVWRCWSDKLLFHTREAEGKSVVEVFAVPSLRISVGKEEQVLEVSQLISQLNIEDR